MRGRYTESLLINSEHNEHCGYKKEEAAGKKLIAPGILENEGTQRTIVCRTDGSKPAVSPGGTPGVFDDVVFVGIHADNNDCVVDC